MRIEQNIYACPKGNVSGKTVLNICPFGWRQNFHFSFTIHHRPHGNQPATIYSVLKLLTGLDSAAFIA